MINIKGSYIIKAGDKTYRSDNLITLLGESFFLNRAVNSLFDPIEYIVFGNSNVKAKKSDLSLGRETVRKKCLSQVDIDRKQIILTCSCTADEIINTSEIGVHNGDILISHDNYELEDDFISPTVDSVEVTYSFQFIASAIINEWTHYSTIDTQSENYNIYYTTSENLIIGVTEENTQSGYRQVDSINNLKTITGAYYYDMNSKTLYIRTTRNNNPNNDNYEITVQTR